MIARYVSSKPKLLKVNGDLWAPSEREGEDHGGGQSPQERRPEVRPPPLSLQSRSVNHLRRKSKTLTSAEPALLSGFQAESPHDLIPHRCAIIFTRISRIDCPAGFNVSMYWIHLALRLPHRSCKPPARGTTRLARPVSAGGCLDTEKWPRRRITSGRRLQQPRLPPRLAAWRRQARGYRREATRK